MSIAFSGGVGSAHGDLQLGSKNASGGQGEGLFENFSMMLASLNDEQSDGLFDNKQINISLGELGGKLGSELSPQDLLSQVIDNEFIKFDNTVESLVEEHGLDGLIGHLENGGNILANLDLSATASFVDSRLNLVTNDIVTNDIKHPQNYSGFNLSSLEKLLVAIDLADGETTGVELSGDTFKDYKIEPALNEMIPGAAISSEESLTALTDLPLGAAVPPELDNSQTKSLMALTAPLQGAAVPLELDSSQDKSLRALTDLLQITAVPLELDVSQASSIFFDIRDLKASLQGDDLNGILKNSEAIASGEILVPQVVPIEIENTQVGPETFDKFISVKVDLLDAQGGLEPVEVYDFNLQKDEFSSQGLIGVTRAVEIDPSVDPRSKLLVVLAIPEKTTLEILPDFVRFQISLARENYSGVVQDHGMALQPRALMPDASISEVDDTVQSIRELVRTLSEMSTAPSHTTQIVLQTNVVGREAASYVSNVGAAQQDNFAELQSTDVQNKFNNLTQNKLILEQVIQHSSGMIDRKYDNLAASIFAIEGEVKSFLDSKNDKIAFLNEGVDENLIEFKNTSKPFNPRSFLEAAEALRMTSVARVQFEAPTGSSARVGLISGEGINLTTPSNEKLSYQIASQTRSLARSSGSAPNLTNNISLYDAQYASKISMLVVDKVLSGNENFEINLEPESFGKIRVNISMDKQSIDIRMFAETQAAASILRANEDSLLQITSQNGMKLAGFSVGMQSGADQQRQNENQSRNKAAGKANSALERTTPLNTQTASSYRTPTGLNLIA
ncbi:flagellar hook-length control protein FliK [Planktomarina temperata]|nr:flagellar hook-length control protein FliK [Planktomarina temperata]MDB9833264.1 flagellar hook-length control protein FliK [Planktomarina temperata]